MQEYNEIIERGRSDLNDCIIDFLRGRIQAPYLDVGCNTGFLLSELPGGVGVEKSYKLVEKAKDKGLVVFLDDFSDSDLCLKYGDFKTVVFSCVLQHIENWQSALNRGLSIATHEVVGVNPYPDRTVWGKVNGNKWTKSVIDPELLKRVYNAEIIDIEGTHYFFRILMSRHSQ